MKTQFELAMEELRLSREFLGLFKDDFFFEKKLSDFLDKKVEGIYIVSGQGKSTHSVAEKLANSLGKNEEGYKAAHASKFGSTVSEVYGDIVDKFPDSYDEEIKKIPIDKKKKDVEKYLKQYAVDEKFEGNQQIVVSLDGSDHDYIDVLIKLNLPVILITGNERDPLIDELDVRKTTEEKIFDR